MATFTLGEELNQVLDEIEEQRREAWAAYLEATTNLKGDRYRKVEVDAWKQLQTNLERLENKRSTLPNQSVDKTISERFEA